MIDSGEKLNVDTESAIHIGAWFGNQSLCKFPLKHQHGTSEHWTMRQKFENKRRRNLIRRICDTNIKERHLSFDCITLNESKFIAVTQFIDTLRHFSDHSWINFHCNDLLASLQKLYCQVTSTWSNFENDVSWFDATLFYDLFHDFGILEDMLTK